MIKGSFWRSLTVVLMFAAILAGQTQAEGRVAALDYDRSAKQVLLTLLKFDAGFPVEVNAMHFDVDGLTFLGMTSLARVPQNGTVRLLDIDPIMGDSTAVLTATFDNPFGNGDPSIDLSRIPEIGMTQLITNVSIPDRGTILLGGFRQTGSVKVTGAFNAFKDGENSVFVGQSDIPIAGMLFKQTPAFKTTNGLAAPKLLSLNNEQAVVVIGEQLNPTINIVKLDNQGNPVGAPINLNTGVFGQTNGGPLTAVRAGRSNNIVALQQYFDAFATGPPTVLVAAHSFDDGKTAKYNLTRGNVAAFEVAAASLKAVKLGSTDPQAIQTTSGGGGSYGSSNTNRPAYVTTYVRDVGGVSDIAVVVNDKWASEVTPTYGVNDPVGQGRFVANPQIVSIGHGRAVIAWNESDGVTDTVKIENLRVLSESSGKKSYGKGGGDQALQCEQFTSATGGSDSGGSMAPRRTILRDMVLTRNPISHQYTGSRSYSIAEDPQEIGNLTHMVQVSQTAILSTSVNTVLWEFAEQVAATEAQSLQVDIEARFLSIEDDFFDRVGVDFDFSIEDTNGVISPIANIGAEVDFALPDTWTASKLQSTFNARFNVGSNSEILATADDEMLARYLSGEPMISHLDVSLSSEDSGTVLIDDISVTITAVLPEPVPEPTSLLILSPVAVIVMRRRRRRSV